MFRPSPPHPAAPTLLRASATAIALALSLSTAPVAAQPAVTPPQVIAPAPPDYPEAAKAARIEGDVVLRLDVGIDGSVTRAEIATSTAPELDEAARATALRLRFTPARKGEKAVAARILYAIEFRLPPPVIEGPADDAPEDPAPPPPEQPAPVAPVAPPSLAEEVTVRGTSDADRLRQSALAIHVVDLREAQHEAADLGEVLARNQGIGVQRDGGLGSTTRFSLNGLTDDQVRFFLDGVPLDLAGYPWGVANVPVNLVQRVEVYRGVVPIRFGADALGGAVNLVTDPEVRGSHGALSYQVGSFGTHRATGAVHTHDPLTGLFTRASAYWDHADNDYPVQVQSVNRVGEITMVTAKRFNDRYDAAGANVESGFVRRAWAKKLLVRGFVTGISKELQNNPVMTVPFGATAFDRKSAGISAHYEHVLAGRFPVDALVGYTYNQTSFRDLGTCVYSWYGQCGLQRPQPGEIDNKPHDLVIWDKTTYARARLGWKPNADHGVQLSLSPTHTARRGDERRPLDPRALDPETASRTLFSFVAGVEETSSFFDTLLENIVFGKAYFQNARAQDALIGSGTFKEIQRDTHRFGMGDSLRYRFFPWLYAKASYEWATRLPGAYEVFGDGVLIAPNLQLAPETSHNGNIGVTLDLKGTRLGSFRADTNGFLRAADDLIVLLGNERNFIYQNVYGARAVGIEASSGWTSPGDFFSIDGNVTYQDFRNTERAGPFALFEGDRIPNRPYFFANGSSRLLFRSIASKRDELSFSWNTRWVHEFFRSWESAGSRSYKPYVPSQLLHSAAATYLTHTGDVTMTFTGEVQNLTDEQAFDFYGVQKPGRAFYFKTTIEL